MKITEREKLFLIGGGAFFGLVVIFYLFLYVKNNLFSVEDESSLIQEEIRKIEEYGKKYQQLVNLKAQNDYNLDPMSATIESLLQKNGLHDNVRVRPVDSVIENKYLKRQISVDIREVSAMQMMQFIKDVEENTILPVTVEYFLSRPVAGKPGYYMLSLKVSAFTKK